MIFDDNTGPVFSMVNDVTVTADPETCTGAVTLIVTATSCGDPVDVTNDFNDGGGNASGSYPIGQTIVTFTAEDECCNVSTLMVAVNVVDAGEAEFVCFKPVYCIPDELELTLNACEFIMFSNPDGCLTKDDYYFSYSNDDPFDSLQTWTCADAGSVPLVEIFTYDFQLNLVDSCLGDLDINDGPPACPTTNCGNPDLNIQGEVFTEDGVMPVTISDLSMPMAYTAIDGSYAFANLQQGGNYVVAPQRNDNPLEGVTTLDLVAIQKHLLGIKPLTSPYQKIAADVIANGSISALDLLELRKMLLGYQQEFSDNTSWRFVDAHYDFPDPFNPFMIPFPEEMIIGELNHDMTEVDFIGVKTGDVNNTVSSIYSHDVEVSSDRAVALVYPDLDLDRGQTIRIPVSTVNFENIVGYQFELQLDTERIDFVRIELPDGTHLTEENFGLGRVDEGRILVSWSAASGLDVDGAHPIFEVVGIARSSGSANGLIELQSRSLHGEAYVDGNVETVLNLDLFLADQDDVAAEAAVPVSLMQNRPNPFNESTEIPLYLAQDGSVELLVHGIDGRLVYTERKDLNKGLHVMRISSKSLPSAGIYYYTVITDKFQATRRMTLLD